MDWGKGVVLGLVMALSAVSASASAVCDKRFDGVWGWEAEAEGQCTVWTFANDSTKGQVGTGTWTNFSLDCRHRHATQVLEVEYDNKHYGNLSARMVDANTCLVTMGKGRVHRDIYRVWKPLSNRLRIRFINRRMLELCYENAGHMLGRCNILRYSGPWG